jgi:hypothetical protein
MAPEGAGTIESRMWTSAAEPEGAMRSRLPSLSIPVQGWVIDADHFHTKAKNFFDHNNIGNSNAFIPLTIDDALIQGNELTVRSPKFWSGGQAHLTYSNQTADGYGAINGGLTDFSPPAGFFALDHDQRNTANVGLNANLPRQSFASADVYVGSGISNGSGTRPSHLPGHAELNLSAVRAWGQTRDRSTPRCTTNSATRFHTVRGSALPRYC